MADFALVTPSYNQAPFLRAAIDSVLMQTGVQCRYTVRDGGSTDGSVEILRSYGDRVTWLSRPDGGQVRAINAGLSALDGELCGYLNSDDVLVEGALEAVSRIFDEHPEVDVVYGDAWFVKEDGTPARPYPTVDFNFQVLVQHCFLCQPATFWRRRVHERWGMFDPAYDNTFDYEFWLRLACGGARFFRLPQVLAHSREHGATKSQRQRRKIFAEIRRMQLHHLGYCGRNWWEQQLRFWRDESGSGWGRLLPGKPEQRLYGWAWWPYMLWRHRWGGPWRYRPGDWRA
ncbi:MAG TPA: glycosyltransferase family 2 protein [Opitutaceae bacterium]|nr:glycosyltransferase family 2 protein [Opitutaceae bacterium]